MQFKDEVYGTTHGRNQHLSNLSQTSGNLQGGVRPHGFYQHMQVLLQVGIRGVISTPQLLFLLSVPHRPSAQDTHLVLSLRLHSFQRQTLGAKQTADKIVLERRITHQIIFNRKIADITDQLVHFINTVSLADEQFNPI